MRKLLLLGLAFAASGCAQSTIKPAGDPATVDYGRPPTDYKAKIHAHWDLVLKDPSSVQVKSIGKPEKASIYSVEEKPHWYDAYSDVIFTPVYGYRVCAVYNAKNSYGGYVGAKPELNFFDHDGKLIVPMIVTADAMNGMHRKGDFGSGIYVALQECQ